MRNFILLTLFFLFVVFATSCDSSERVNVDYQPTEESVVAMIKQSATTTRNICTSCGCKADLINCSCPTQKRLDCVLDNSVTAIRDIKPKAPEVGSVKGSIH